MTVASGTLLVVSIASFNIIWGYPWLGVFAACLALFVLGRLASSFLRPKLSYHLTMPRSIPVGFPLAVVIKCRNRGRFPAMKFLVSFDRTRVTKRRWFRKESESPANEFSTSEPQPIHLLESGKTERVGSTICFSKRGTRRLPPIVTRSFFPFYFFQVTQHHPLNQEIVVTPRPLDENLDETAKGFLEAMGEWSHKLLAGDALDYTGSREYEVGMPVRRWDFSSWARLGKPIVREYQSPSIQQVYLIIDAASVQPISGMLETMDPNFERLLSAAATAILDLNKQRVRLQLCLTCDQQRHEQEGGFIQLDTESMLIRLANASMTETKSSDQQIELSLEQVHQSPILILSNRDVQAYPYPLPRSARWLNVSPRNQSVTSQT